MPKSSIMGVDGGGSPSELGKGEVLMGLHRKHRARPIL